MNNPAVNPTSRDWLIVREWAEQRLAEYRARNDSKALDDEATAYLRGRIAETKDVLALGSPPTPVGTVDAPALIGDWGGG